MLFTWVSKQNSMHGHASAPLKQLYHADIGMSINTCKKNSLRGEAKILNISQQHYSLYETGKTVMNVEKLILLCKELNVSADYVLGLSDNLRELKK